MEVTSKEYPECEVQAWAGGVVSDGFFRLRVFFFFFFFLNNFK